MRNPEPPARQATRVPGQTHFGGRLQTVLSQRTLTVFSCVWIAAILTPMILLCFYAHPVYDDYLHTQSVVEAWARTGSPGGALAAAWSRMLWMYQNWQGTYIAMFFSAFAPSAFSERLYFLSPLFTLFALTFSAGYLSHTVTRTALQMPRGSSLLVFAAFLTLSLAYLPGADEVIYWQSGVFYALSPAALTLAVGLLMKQHLSPPRVGRVVALFFCGAFLGGSTYPLALGGCVLLALIAAFTMVRRSGARWSALVAFLATAISLLVVVLAPGNTLRQARYGAAMEPVSAVIQSVAECLQTTGTWFSPQLAAVGLMLTTLLWEPLANSGIRLRHPVWMTFFSFAALASAFVPAIFATGVEGGRIDRIQATLYLFFVLVILASLIGWLGWLAPRYSGFHPVPTRWLAMLCAALAVWGLFSSAIMTTPVVSSAVNLVDGSAAAYDTQMTARETAIAAAANAAEGVATVQELASHPSLFPSDGMALQKDALVPVMHRYYGIQTLLARYPAGSIPQAEWTRLDAW